MQLEWSLWISKEMPSARECGSTEDALFAPGGIFLVTRLGVPGKNSSNPLGCERPSVCGFPGNRQLQASRIEAVPGIHS